MSDRPGEGYTFRYSQLVQRLLAAKGGEPLPELTPELMAGIILENDRLEYSHLGDEEPASGEQLVPAVALNISQSGVGNPTGSGILVVVEGCINNLNTTVNVLRGVSLLSGFTQVGAMYRDTRKRAFSTGVTVAQLLSKNNLAAGVGNVLGTLLPSGVLFPPRGLVVLTPGFGIAADPNAVNAPADVTWFWRERAVEVSELKG